MKKHGLTIGAVAATACVAVASADVIHWDDIVTDGSFLTPVPSDYLGHTWSGTVHGGGRGYVDLLSAIRSGWFANIPDISAPNIFYNGFGDDDVWVELDGDYTFNSINVTGWPNTSGFAESVRIVGLNDGNVMYDETIPTINDQWTFVDAGGVVVDEIHFYRPVGEPKWWLADDLDLSAGGLSLNASGSCPGQMSFTASGATPGGNVAFIYAFGTGSVNIPPGNPCAGTALGLNATATLGGTETADANGEATLTTNVPAAACGRVFVQALDVSSCATSNVFGL